MNGRVELGVKLIFNEKLRWDNDKNAIDFKWLDEQIEDEEDNAKANLIENLQKQTRGFPKK